MKRFASVLPLVVVLALAGVAFMPQNADIYFLIKKNFSIFSKTYESVALEYVDQVDPEKLMRTGLDAMMETLDPYTVIYSESQNEQSEILSRGNYAGIGIEAGYRDEEVVVVAPTEGGPADRMGIRAGDVIIAIDSISVTGLLPDEVQNLTLGEVGSTVTLTIQRVGVDQPLDFTLPRERISVSNVSYYDTIGENGNVGYIRLAQFGDRSADQIRNAILELTERGSTNGLVLDLRDNPGGILQEAVAIIDKFVEPGLTVVENRGRIAEYNQTFETREPVLFDKPVVVLMNGGSASASEVVAGALQDLDRAVILGERSFGKGLVQIVKSLPYNTSMSITIARYYIPSGRSIQAIDYTHEGRNSGVVNRSLSSREFKTRNGRTVFEGRGIDPDITLEEAEASLLQISLLQNGSYFDFATQYYASQPNEDFVSLPAGTFDAFKQYLNLQDFNYQTDSEELLTVLRRQLGDNREAGEKIQEIEAIIQQEKEEQLEEEREIIEQNLYLEILSRYKGQTARTAAALDSDPQLLKALELISNEREISSILSNTDG